MKIALAGNPNVGKSTVFNALTGMNQHTGNWTGKTVDLAYGKIKNTDHYLYDLPGTYSLKSHSKEEEIASNFICFDKPDKVIVVCDAVCLERNLNLVLQVLELTDDVIVCVNMMDEAKKKKIKINLKKLSKLLGVPVVGITARSNKGLNELLNALNMKTTNPLKIKYSEEIEEKISILENLLENRWQAIRTLERDQSIIDRLENKHLIEQKIMDINTEELVSTIVKKAEEIANSCITFENKNYNERNKKIDKILTNKYTGIPIMLLLLMVIFWITIKGANYPSGILYNFFSSLEPKLSFLPDFLVLGVYRVLTWIISVMLPPMTIFFPLFTLLEDLGYLPRIAFNLDKVFNKCKTCGKQALTMCMGFGCNAVGVTGARIIDSPRERLIAILTNVFVPCNGRFPTIIAIITMFLATNSIMSVSILMLVIVLGVMVTFLTSYVLSKTILKGVPSSFTLELPSYRKPQVFKVIVRSIFDRTLHVLGRSIIIAAPAGLLIYILANNYIDGISLLNHIANFLDKPAYYIGLDGVILLAFILGFPANEIVIPIMIMTYMSTNTLVDFSNLNDLKILLINNGWTTLTAVCTIIFSLLHFPCSTTCLTIRKETKSWKWILLGIIIPTLVGVTLCFIITTIVRMF